MNLAHSLERITCPAILNWLAFTLLSSAFVGGYFVVGYQYYLKTYQTTQNQEIETVHQKMEGTLKQLKELLDLSETLIMTMIQKNSPKASRLNQEVRLREILNAVSLLEPASNLPSLQKVAFYKISPPQIMVTRFGALPFNPAKIPIEKLMSQHWDPQLVLEEGATMARVNVGKLKSDLEGVLEIQVSLVDFKRFLGTYQTITLNERLGSNFLIDKNHFPFLLVKNSPLSFQAYALTQSSHYWIVVGYLITFLLLLGICLYCLNWYVQKSYSQRIKNLEGALLTVKTAEETLKATLGKQQQDFEVYAISHEAQKNFHGALAEKQRTQANQIVDLLEAIKTSQSSILGGDEEVDYIRMETCLKQARALSNGLWNPIRTDTVDLKIALKNLDLLFAEKLYQSNIRLEMDDLPNLPHFKGDCLLIDIFLMNVVGKAIYRVPDNGMVSITAKETSGFVHLQVKDTGYGGVLLAEKMIQQTFSLFIEESTFKRLCNENGVYTKYSKSPHGLNITQLVIPLFTASEEGSSSNVVQLFH